MLMILLFAEQRGLLLPSSFFASFLIFLIFSLPSPFPSCSSSHRLSGPARSLCRNLRGVGGIFNDIRYVIPD
ncbi:hypothetical protein B0H17DRAFT_1065207 [Mycena rosella]|uniref:Uncharacterized protein n=1 Tax=Mycena rosella TaxID=1033263 RepID=A0AAD7GJ48_MYCRO|nr:hypothetical protein B0H17DRAFT_1065207 [Mycena rosella]